MMGGGFFPSTNLHTYANKAIGDALHLNSVRELKLYLVKFKNTFFENSFRWSQKLCVQNLDLMNQLRVRLPSPSVSVDVLLFV